VLFVSCVMAWTSSAAVAGYKTDVGGISVSYSKAGAVAFFDADDGTLTIGIAESGGALKITVGPSAFLAWGDYVDIFISAESASPKSIKVIGSASCIPFVVGAVFYMNSFTLQDGVIGNSTFYGPLFGLAVTSGFNPTKMVLKRSFTTAPLAWLTPAFEESALAAQASPRKEQAASAFLVGIGRHLRPSAAKQELIRRVQAGR
jgi:uncharacterized membrane protein